MSLFHRLTREMRANERGEGIWKTFQKYLHALSYRQYFYLPIKSMECSIIMAMRVPMWRGKVLIFVFDITFCYCLSFHLIDFAIIFHACNRFKCAWMPNIYQRKCSTFFSPPQSVKSIGGKHKVKSNTSINVMPTSHQLFACFDTIIRLLHGKYVFLAVNRNDYTDGEKKCSQHKINDERKKNGRKYVALKKFSIGPRCNDILEKLKHPI